MTVNLIQPSFLCPHSPAILISLWPKAALITLSEVSLLQPMQEARRWMPKNTNLLASLNLLEIPHPDDV